MTLILNKKQKLAPCWCGFEPNGASQEKLEEHEQVHLNYEKAKTEDVSSGIILEPAVPTDVDIMQAKWGYYRPFICTPRFLEILICRERQLREALAALAQVTKVNEMLTKQLEAKTKSKSKKYKGVV